MSETKISLGNKEILLNTSLLIPKDETVKIELDTKDGNPIVINIGFAENEDADKAKIEVSGENDVGLILFTNWIRPMGHTMVKAIQVAQSEDGDVISFLATASKTGDVYRLNIQFMKEAGNESK